jgi:hypothetical protein
MKVLYIAGVPRSGSTLIGEVIGEAEDAAFVGEVWDLYGQFRNSGKCGCGHLLQECPYWSRVTTGNLDLEAFNKVAHSKRVRDLLVNPNGVAEDTAPVAQLYRQVQSLFDASILVDTSKFPSYLHVLDQTLGFDVKVLHLIRDPRAVVYSWLKRPLHDKERDPGLLDTLTNFQFRNPVRWGLVWTEWNYLLQSIWGDSENYCMVRYEDFCQSPRSVLHQALADLGIEERPQWESEREIELSTHHTVKGNPDRFTSGRIRIEERTEWKDKMSSSVSFLTILLASPQLRRFGYEFGFFS